MDTELIIYIVAFIFFVLPSILRRLGKKAGPGKKKASLLPGKLGDKVRDLFRELERQAQEARKETEGPRDQTGSGPENQGIWDMLDDRDEAGTKVQASSAALPDDDSRELAPEIYHSDQQTPPRDSVQARPSPALSEPVINAQPLRWALPPHALQQAVVWKEILGPPKGLQD